MANATRAITNSPKPINIPIAAAIQIEAAVVIPETDPLFRKITPAPRKPTPVMMLAAIRSRLSTTPNK